MKFRKRRSTAKRTVAIRVRRDARARTSAAAGRLTLAYSSRVDSGDPSRMTAVNASPSTIGVDKAVFMPWPPAGLWTCAASPISRSGHCDRCRRADDGRGSASSRRHRCTPAGDVAALARRAAVWMSSTSGFSGASSIVATIRKRAVGKGRDHDHARRREEQRHLVATERPVHFDVGEDEGFAIGLRLRTRCGRVADGAVHSVRPDDVAGPDRSASPLRPH